MAKKARPKPCVVCSGPSKKGLKACEKHVHIATLQQEIHLLRLYQGPGFEMLLRYPAFRQVAENLAVAHFRAEAHKGGSMAIVGNRHKLGPEDSDGIAVIGDHIALPKYAVGQLPDKSILDATLRRISDCGKETAELLDANAPKPVDLRKRCGRSHCPGKNRRQPGDVQFCGWCSRDMTEEA